MRIRMPQPLHGWRPFAGEVGVVVLGVLIALAAGQAVESLNWQRQVSEAKDALGFELADAIGQANQRQALSPCIQRRLDELSTMIEQGSEGGRLPPAGEIGSPPYYTWVTATWETTMASQTASHFDRRELNGLARIYEYVNLLKTAAPRELTVWSRLYSVVGPGRALSPEEAASLRRDVAEARLLDQLIAVSAMRVRQIADRERINYDRAFVERRNRPASSYPLCHPMPLRGADRYGHAPMEGSLQEALDHPLRGPN